MEAYSSSSSAYLHQDSKQVEQGLRAPNRYHASPHSVRKATLKPWKKPIAPLPPTRPRVYKVDPVNFRDLVQKLTGSCESQSQRLRSVAPPPLDVAPVTCYGSNVNNAAVPIELLPSPVKTPFTALYNDLMSDVSDPKTQKISDCGMETNSLGLSLSPHSWSAFPLWSPGTLSNLEQSTVL